MRQQPGPGEPATTLTSALAASAAIPGWLTEDQARVLWQEATQVPASEAIVEIGSHHGRSTVVLAAGSRGAQVVAIDPFLPDWRYGAPDTRARFEHNLTTAGLRDRVELIAQPSRTARGAWRRPIGLLYIDGKHDYWSATDDLRWAERLAPGATILMHDAYSSLGVTAALLPQLLFGRRLTLRGRTGSLVALTPTPPQLRDRLAALGPVPWWLRNLAIKILLRARAYPLARLLGHRITADPY